MIKCRDYRCPSKLISRNIDDRLTSPRMKQTQRIQKTLVLASNDSTDRYDMEFRKVEHNHIQWNLYFISEWMKTASPASLSHILKRADGILVKNEDISEDSWETIHLYPIPVYSIPNEVSYTSSDTLLKILDYMSTHL